MDLAEFGNLPEAQEAGIDITIIHPKTNEEMDIVIKVAGPESKRQKRYRNMLMNERLMKNRNRRPTAAELDADAIRLSAASIISWKGITISGKDIELSQENAEMVLTNYAFIRDQVDSAVNDRSLFIKS